MRKQLVNATNLSATTRYYPAATSDRGMPIGDEATRIALEMVCSGGVTVTVEATLIDKDRDKDSGALINVENWIDITKLCKSANTGVDGAASFVDKSDIILVPPTLKLARLPIKSVTSDASNGVFFAVAVD